MTAAKFLNIRDHSKYVQIQDEEYLRNATWTMLKNHYASLRLKAQKRLCRCLALYGNACHVPRRQLYKCLKLQFTRLGKSGVLLPFKSHVNMELAPLFWLQAPLSSLLCRAQCPSDCIYSKDGFSAPRGQGGECGHTGHRTL